MTLVLGATAAILLLAIVSLAVQQSRPEEVLGTASGSTPTATGSLDIAPQAVFAGPTHAAAAAPASSSAALGPSLDQFLPGNLGVGTALSYNGTTSVIGGVFSFDFDGELWQDYLAEDIGGNWWRFGVEPNRGFRLAAFKPHLIPVEPGQPTMLFDGESYAMTESGIANFRAAGQTGTFDTGKYWYFDYENETGTILSFERFDHGSWKTSVGYRVDPRQVAVDNHLVDSP